MYKDFKKSESLDTGFVGGSGIMWMFSGVVLGLVVGIGMYYFSTNNASPFSGIDSVQKEIERTQKFKPRLSSEPVNIQTAKKKKATRENKFSYYAVLPNLDVPVNSAKPINNGSEKVSTGQNEVLVSEKENLKAEEAKTIDEEIRRGNYLLQVASYRKKSKANFTRGRLSKKGVDAYIQKKKIKGRLWYRVVAGPTDQSGADSWKMKAEQLGHRPLIISVR